jgi:PAS domain S-box-containing protein
MPGDGAAGLKPELPVSPAPGLALIFAVALVLVAVLPRWAAEGSPAWYGLATPVASLGLLIAALLIMRRHHEKALAEASRRMAELNTRIATGATALAASEARLRRAQRIGRVGGFEIDLRSGLNHRSGEYMSVQGLPGEERIERHQDWVDRLHPEDRERAERIFREAVSDHSGATDYAQEYRIIAPDGETRWIAARGEIARDAAGRALCMVGAHVDVTALKQAEAGRRVSEERLRLAQEAAGLGIWERDLLTGEAVWSPEQYLLMGFDPAEPPPHRDVMRERVLPEDRPGLVMERMSLGQASAFRADGAFRHQFRIHHPKDGDIRCILGLGRVFRDTAGRPSRIIGVNLDITDRVRAEERQALLTRELDHRAKNALAVVQAALRLTPRDDPDAFARAVQGRVAALTRAHTLLAEGGWTGAELRAVLQGELDPFLSNAAQVVLEGPAVMLAAVAAQPIAMAVHELATNAMKYGALSASTGQITVRWRIAEERTLEIDWAESGGPAVAGGPSRRGFGSRVIEATLGGQLGGTVAKTWAATGMQCRITLPVARVTVAARTMDAPPELSFGT